MLSANVSSLIKSSRWLFTELSLKNKNLSGMCIQRKTIFSFHDQNHHNQVLPEQWHSGSRLAAERRRRCHECWPFRNSEKGTNVRNQRNNKGKLTSGFWKSSKWGWGWGASLVGVLIKGAAITCSGFEELQRKLLWGWLGFVIFLLFHSFYGHICWVLKTSRKKPYQPILGLLQKHYIVEACTKNDDI